MVDVEFLRSLPKCEHHVHLEGTLSPNFLFQLAKLNDVELPPDFPNSVEELQNQYDKFTGLDSFLHYYYIGMSVLITEQDFEDLTYEYFKQCWADGVVHAEISFDPQAHLSRGISFETLIKGITAGRDRAFKDLGISSRVIMCILRHVDIKDGLKVVEYSKPFVQMGLIDGLGLDSSEKGKNPNKFKDIYQEASNVGYKRFTAHAGEEGPAEYVSEALDQLGVSRIDHGVRAADDAKVLNRLADENIMLTACPISNLKLKVVDDIGNLPFREFLKYNVPFSVNCDDPAYFGGGCLDNYIAIDENFKFDKSTWKKICKYGVEGSWIQSSQKDKLLTRLKSLE